MVKYIKYKKGLFILGLFIATLTVISESVFALVMKEIIDNISTGSGTIVLNRLPIYLIYIFIMISLSFINTLVITNFIKQVMTKLRKDLFEKILEYKILDFEKKNIGDYVSIFNNDVNMIEQDYLMNIFDLYSNVLGIVIQVIVALVINVPLTCIVMFIGFIILIFPVLFTKSIERRREALLNSYEKMNGSLNNYFTGFQNIKISRIEKVIVEKWNVFNNDVEKKKFKYTLVSSVLNSLLRILSLSVIIFILVLGSYFVIKSSISIGSLVAIIQLYSGIFQQVGTLSYKMNSFSTVKPVIERINAYLKHESFHGKGKKIESAEIISFRDVDFSYDNKTMVLKNVNLDFEKGKKYAIIGDSGSGKSTLINLLLKKIEPTNGKILVDGEDYTEGMPMYNLISYVSQNVFLFCDTLKFNLFLTDESESINLNNLFSIFELSKYINTNLNEVEIKEAANNISGGEKQRIGIIRELIKHKPILITDEATSNVNSSMSAKIYNYLLGKDGYMLISIMHNYTEDILRKFDSVILVRNGEVLVKNMKNKSHGN